MLAQGSTPTRDINSTEITPRRPLREGERVDVWFSTRTATVRGGGYAMMRGVFTIPRLGIRREFDPQTEPARCSARAGGDDAFTFRCLGDTRGVTGTVTVEGGVLRVEIEVHGEGYTGGAERFHVRLPARVRVAYHGGTWRL